MLADIIAKLTEGDLVFLLVAAMIAGFFVLVNLFDLIGTLGGVFVRLVHGHKPAERAARDADDLAEQIRAALEDVETVIKDSTGEVTGELSEIVELLRSIDVSNEYLAETEREFEREENEKRAAQHAAFGDPYRPAPASFGTALHHYAEQAAEYARTYPGAGFAGERLDVVLTDDMIDEALVLALHADAESDDELDYVESTERDDDTDDEGLDVGEDDDEAIDLTKPERAEYRPTDLR